MKRMIPIFLTLTLLAGLCACGGSGGTTAGTPDTDPLTLLETVWDSYGDAEKFAVYGGGPNGEDMVDGAPGAFALDDPEALDTVLGFPAGEADRLDGAASLIHGMNANTFTCGAFHTAAGEDVSALAQAAQDNIAAREWICGFPEQLVVATYGNCVVVCFGAKDLTDVFLTKLSGAFPEAVTVCDQPIL